MIFYDDQNPEASFVKELIGDEVHTPAIVLHQGSGSDLPLSTRDTPTGELFTHYEAFLAVEAVDPFVVNLPAFAPEKDVEPAIAVGNSDACQLLQTQPEDQLGICRAPVTVCRPWPLHDPKGPPLARPVDELHLPDEFPAKGRP
jgi:hypothetical protein